MIKIDLSVTITLQGPILSKATTCGSYGVDAAMAVNHKGDYSLPGTLVKGKLLESWEELNTVLDEEKKIKCKQLLGEKSEDEENKEGSFDPNRGILYFHDFISTKKKGKNKQLYRIKVDNERGAVEENSYMVIDSPFEPGEVAEFTGIISFFAKDKEKRLITKNIETGMKWITSFGAERTIGFGRLLSVELKEEVESKVEKPVIVELENDCLYFNLKPKAPFCIAKKRIDKNLFESEEVIPGGSIKGAIAHTWNKILGNEGGIISENTDQARKELCLYFDRIRITHAFPSKDAFYRPVKPPLSLVKISGQYLYDIALHEKAVLLKGQAPAFAVDWKDSKFIDPENKTEKDISTYFGWPELKRELRVRTKIEEETGKAEKNKLFAYEMVVPEEHSWLAKFDLHLVPNKQRKIVLEQLQELLSYGICGLSKTKTPAKIQFVDNNQIKNKIESDYCKPIKLGDKPNWVITLQTPALICDPDRLINNNSAESLHNAYGEAFSQLSGGCLKLKHFYAKQSLAGGKYIHRRFQKNNYKPYLLTESGSVFVLEQVSGTAESDTKKKITDWLFHGLPLPNWAKDRYGERWNQCPYIKENGYGEIAVNLPVHQDFKPEDHEYDTV